MALVYTDGWKNEIQRKKNENKINEHNNLLYHIYSR